MPKLLNIPVKEWRDKVINQIINTINSGGGGGGSSWLDNFFHKNEDDKLATNELIVDENLESNKLKVKNITASGTTHLNNDLYVQGHEYVNGTLTVVTLDVTNSINTTELKLNNIIQNDGNWSIGNTGDAKFNSLSLDGTLNIDGESYFQKGKFYGDVTIDKSLTITGTTRTNGDLKTQSVYPDENSKKNIGKSGHAYKEGYINKIYISEIYTAGTNISIYNGHNYKIIDIDDYTEINFLTDIKIKGNKIELLPTALYDNDGNKIFYYDPNIYGADHGEITIVKHEEDNFNRIGLRFGDGFDGIYEMEDDNLFIGHTTDSDFIKSSLDSSVCTGIKINDNGIIYTFPLKKDCINMYINGDEELKIITNCTTNFNINDDLNCTFNRIFLKDNYGNSIEMSDEGIIFKYDDNIIFYINDITLTLDANRLETLSDIIDEGIKVRKEWTGTQDEYDSLEEYDEEMTYYIFDNM